VIAEVDAAVTRAFREEWGQIVATLIGLTGDWDLAEECAQDAFAQALQRWPRDGIPRRPGAWLTTTARNRVTDRLRREAVGVAKLRETAMLSAPDEPGDDAAAVSGIPDDRLRLMFTCCHPALAFELRVALTLRTLAGLTTAEIARRSWCRRTRCPSAWSAPSVRSATPASRSEYRPPICLRSGPPRYWECCICCSTRATRPARAPIWYART